MSLRDHYKQLYDTLTQDGWQTASIIVLSPMLVVLFATGGMYWLAASWAFLLLSELVTFGEEPTLGRAVVSLGLTTVALILVIVSFFA